MMFHVSVFFFLVLCIADLSCLWQGSVQDIVWILSGYSMEGPCVKDMGNIHIQHLKIYDLTYNIPRDVFLDKMK